MPIINWPFRPRAKTFTEDDLKGEAELFIEGEVNRTQERTERQSAARERRYAAARQSSRTACFVMATLRFTGHGYAVDGVITDISKMGVTFRPSSRFILIRNGDVLDVVSEGIDSAGVIRSTRPDGYGIRLLSAYTDEEIQHILSGGLDHAAFA